MMKVQGAGIILFIFLCSYNFNYGSTADLQANYDHYEIQSKLPILDATVVKLRTKRQTTDQKNQYQSVPLNPTTTTNNNNDPKLTPQQAPAQAPQPQTPGAVTINGGGDTSIVVPYNAADHPLLGANGTGQRKDYSNEKLDGPTTILTETKDNRPTPKKDMKKIFLSTPINGTKSVNTAADGAPAPAAVPAAAAAPGANPALGADDDGFTSQENPDQVIDSIDVPENDTLTELKKHYKVNTTQDYHNYYNSTTYVNPEEVTNVWETVKNLPINSMLSQSHRRAMTMELSFDFPFYGHLVRNITVATGGFLYTGEYVHSWLAATQYIAPLMANFDTSVSNDSYVRLKDNGTAFTVVWENVSLQDKQDVGKFTFVATLHKNGDIVFTYVNIPIVVHSIQDDKHPVKVGLSDAYIIDKVVYFARRKTIYEYHRVNFNSAVITNSTVIYLKALPTCLAYTDCVSCVEHETSFDCTWCPIMNRCSTGTDRKKQEWLSKGCDRSQITNINSCPAIGEKGNNYNQTIIDATQSNNNKGNKDNDSNRYNYNNNNNNNNQHHDGDDDAEHTIHSHELEGGATIQTITQNPSSKAMLEADSTSAEQHKSMGVALGFLIPICLVVTAILWVFYAYRNPHTKSGQLLIQYRPSQWSWRRGEARYTAATIHM